MEQVLSPQAPMEPLPLPDYLNCLCTVEQQTAALFGMLKVSKHASIAVCAAALDCTLDLTGG